MRRFQIVGSGVRVSRVVIVGVELDAGDVLLKPSDRDRAGELFAPSPNQIEPAAEHGGEGVDVLVPRAVEVAEEEQVVVLEVFPLLSFAQEGERPARNDDPSRKLDEREIDQVIL